MNNDNQIQHKIGNLIAGRLNHDFGEQVAEAVGVVSDIEEVDSRKAFLKVQSRINNCKKYMLLINTLSRVAAVLFLPLLVATGIILYQQFSLKENQQFAIQEITSPVGVRSQIVLPDGSNVWLNAESTIKFKVPFDKTSRDISLSGEAFFDVRKYPKLPFVVKSGNVNIRVLGTRFNYKAYDEENNIEVVLAEGKVSINTNGEKIGNEVTMKPGDRAVFDKTTGTTQITNEKIEKYIAWHNGKLVFDETPMPEVAAQIGRWFGIEVIINDTRIKNYRITTTFEGESLHQVLELLKLSSPIAIQYIPATLNKANQVQTKSKVIFSKKN
jgi:ferric-dicitrate binding protein FerR (iron transport regulator)